MKKVLLAVVFSALALPAYAVPNVWGSTVGTGGYTVYYINDANSNYLRVSCNEGAGSAGDHDIHFEYKNGKTVFNNQHKQPLTFLFDNKESVSTWGETKSRTGAAMWNELIKHIAKAKLIEVFVDNKKVSTLQPSSNSIKEYASEIADCKPMLEQK